MSPPTEKLLKKKEKKKYKRLYVVINFHRFLDQKKNKKIKAFRLKRALYSKSFLFSPKNL
jgi:hypothetical protein